MLMTRDFNWEIYLAIFLQLVKRSMRILFMCLLLVCVGNVAAHGRGSMSIFSKRKKDIVLRLRTSYFTDNYVNFLFSV